MSTNKIKPLNNGTNRKQLSFFDFKLVQKFLEESGGFNRGNISIPLFLTCGKLLTFTCIINYRLMCQLLVMKHSTVEF